MRQNIYEHVFNGTRVIFSNYGKEGPSPEKQRVLNAKKRLAIEHHNIEDALNVLLTCKQIAEEARPILVACTHLCLTCGWLDHIPAHIRQYWLPRIESVDCVPCLGCPLELKLFTSLRQLRFVVERYPCRGREGELTVVFKFGRRLSETQVAKTMEGGLDSKLATAAKSAMLNQGSWIKNLLGESHASYQVLVQLCGEYVSKDAARNFLCITYDPRSLKIVERLVLIKEAHIRVVKQWESGQVATRSSRLITSEGTTAAQWLEASYAKWDKVSAVSLSEEPEMLKLTVVKPKDGPMNALEIRPIDEDSDSDSEDSDASGDSETSEDDDNAGDDEGAEDEDSAEA
jgi:hypothetical protein